MSEFNLRTHAANENLNPGPLVPEVSAGITPTTFLHYYFDLQDVQRETSEACF